MALFLVLIVPMLNVFTTHTHCEFQQRPLWFKHAYDARQLSNSQCTEHFGATCDGPKFDSGRYMRQLSSGCGLGLTNIKDPAPLILDLKC